MLHAPGTPPPSLKLPPEQLCNWCGVFTPTRTGRWSSTEDENVCPACGHQRHGLEIVPKGTPVLPRVLPPPPPSPVKKLPKP